MKYSFRYRASQILKKLGIRFDTENNAAIKNMKRTISALDGGKIIFQIVFDENGDWAAEAQNLEGLITGGHLSDNLNDVITDAIFTYFNVPPEYCDDEILLSRAPKKSEPSQSRRIFAIMPSPAAA